MHAIGLGFATFALWLLLSGHFEPLLLGFGVASTIGVVLIALRMEVVDHEAVPLHVRPRFIAYLAWLAAEIAKANIDVARLILNPKLPISPQIIRVKMSQKSDLGRVIYANSITLTPGTVSVEVEGDEIVVHAITREMGAALAEGDMDRRVTAVEGA